MTAYSYNDTFLVVGAGSHAHRVAEAIYAAGGTVVGFTTTDASKSNEDDAFSSPSREPLSRALEQFPDAAVAVAVGATKARSEIIETVRRLGRRLPAVVHPAATVSPDSDIGEASVIFAGAVVEWRAAIGVGTIVEAQSVICHEARVGTMCHIQTGSIVGPRAQVPSETRTMIGDRILEGHS
jgi:NDP-sugar pyrophosphorylase family protein